MRRSLDDDKAGKHHYGQIIGKVNRFSWTLKQESWQHWIAPDFWDNQNQTNTAKPTESMQKELLLKWGTKTTAVVYQNRVKQSQNKTKQQICLCIYSRMLPCVLISPAASPLLLRWWHMILSGKGSTHLLEVTIKYPHCDILLFWRQRFAMTAVPSFLSLK